MFSNKDVTALFTTGNERFRRSLTLIHERQRRVPLKTTSTTTTKKNTLTSSASSTSFTETVLKPLHTLSDFGLFIQVCELWQRQLESFLSNLDASTTSKKKVKDKNVCFPRLKRALVLLREAIPRGRQGEELWGSSLENEGGGEADSGEGMSLSKQHAPSLACGGLLAAFISVLSLYADISSFLVQQRCAPANLCGMEKKRVEQKRQEELLQWLQVLSSDVLPSRLFQSFLYELTWSDTSDDDDKDGLGIPPLYCLLPSLIPMVLLHGDEPLKERILKTPFRRFSQNFFQRYLQCTHKADLFRECQLLLQYMVTVMEQLLTLVVVVGQREGVENSSLHRRQAGHTLGDRVELLLKQMIDLLVLPLESSFTADRARPGMSVFLYQALVLPWSEQFRLSPSSQTHHRSRETTASGEGKRSPVVHDVEDDHEEKESVLLTLLHQLSPSHSTTKQNIQAIWYTFIYRLLLIVETLAQAEVSAHSRHHEGSSALGGSRPPTTTHQQRYETLLRHSHSKINLNLLKEITEDKLLLFEACPGARSPSGHVLHKIYDEEEDDNGETKNNKTTYVYVDKGAIYYRREGERDYKRAKGVEELYSIYQS